MKKSLIAALMPLVLIACTAPNEGPMFGRNAQLREISGDITATGTAWWGTQYLVVKDNTTGLRIYVQSVPSDCSAGKRFTATGHLTRNQEKDYDATFHGHLMDHAKACR